MVIRQSKYVKNIVQQDHRAVKQVGRPMLGVKSFWSAPCTIAGVERTMWALYRNGNHRLPPRADCLYSKHTGKLPICNIT